MKSVIAVLWKNNKEFQNISIAGEIAIQNGIVLEYSGIKWYFITLWALAKSTNSGEILQG